MESDTGQQGIKDKRMTERQGHVSRLVSSYRDEAKQLLRDVLRAQNRWSRELEEAVFAGLPGLERPPKTGGHYVRRRLPWRQVERDALKRHLMGLGLGRWREIHAILSNSVRGFKHGPADVEDACWQLLLECQLLLQAPEDRLYLARVLEAVADRGSISTPGAPFSKVQTSARSIVRRLMLLEELNVLMPSFMRSEAVVGIFRALVQTLPASTAPAAWWDVEADVALMVGVHRHGYNNFDTIKKDPVLQSGFQGFHDDTKHKTKPRSQAASPGMADTTEPPTPQQQVASDAEGPVSGLDTPGPTASTDGGAATAIPSAATAAAAAVSAWPSVEVVSKRVRLLSDLVAQAVAIAEAHGLLLPATEAAPGPSYEKQGTKVESKLMGILPYAATAEAAAAGTLDWQLPGLLPATATATAAAAAGAKPGTVGSSSALDRLSGDISGQLDMNEGEIDDLLGEFASPGDRYDAVQEHQDAYAQAEDDGDEVDEEEEEAADHDGSRGAGFGSYFSTGWQSRGRGGRPRKGSQRGSVADAGGDGEGGEGRRRAHRPSKRFADAVLMELDAGDAAYGTGASQGESGAHEVTKKARRELLNLVNTWGPPDATGDAAIASAATAGSDPAAAAVAMAAAGADYDWDAWSGAGGLTGPLHKMSKAELTVMLRELLAEMDDLASAASAAAAAGLNKARNAHQPNCDCVVCTNRRNADQRKKEAHGGAEPAAENAEAEEAAAVAAAAKAAVKPLPKGEVLTAMTAGRLQERIELMALFRSVTGLVGSGQLEAAFKKGAKDLPNWWTPQLDVGLVLGVVTHGYGEWGPIFEDENLPFKATASAAGVVGYDYDPNDPAAAAAMGDAATRNTTAKAKAGLPDWVPDPKVLTKRCKTLVAAIKAKVLGAKGSVAGKQKGGGGKGTKGDEETTGGSGKGKGGKSQGSKTAAASKGGGMGMAGPGGMQMGQLDQAGKLQQMQQLAAMGMLPPNMAAAGGVGGTSAELQQILAQRFAGGPAAAALQQQRQQQLLLLQQQQMLQQQGQQISAPGQLLGKRSAAAAGLPGSSQPLKAAAGAGGPGGAGMASMSAAASVVDTATLRAVVAAAAPGLTPSQIAVLERLPAVTRTDDRQPQLPLAVTDKMTLLALGRVDPTRPAFHSSDRIFPIGLQTAVQYLSAVKRGSGTKYTCVVADGAVAGASGPVFLVVAADAPGQQWLAQSPQTVWQQIHAQVQQAQQVALPPVDGVEQFGLSHPLVAMLIQELPGVEQCAGFDPSQSLAPPQMVTAMRQLQKAMADSAQHQSHMLKPEPQQPPPVQQQLASAGGAAAGQPPAGPAAAAQQEALRAQLLQQQLLRMQQASQMQQQQQLLQVVPAAVGAQPQQNQQQQLLQAIQQQKLMQQNQLLQQQLAAQQLQQQRRSSGTGDGQPQQQAAPGAAAVANPAVLQQLAMFQQRQQQLTQQQPGTASLAGHGTVTPQQAAVLQQMAAARAGSAGVAAGAGAGGLMWPQQQQQMTLTPQQVQQQQQQLLLRQALATSMQPLQQQQQQPGGGGGVQ